MVEDLLRLVDAAHEREHQHDVGEPHLLSYTLHRFALEREPLGVGGMGVTGRAAKAEHRVVLARLEVGPADQARVLVGLEVRHPHDDGLRPEGRGDRADALRQALDEEVSAVAGSRW